MRCGLALRESTLIPRHRMHISPASGRRATRHTLSNSPFTTAMPDTNKTPLVESAPGTTVETVVLPISGMTCASCQTHVERSLRAAPGVVDATVNLLAHSARVMYEPT